MEEEKSAYSQNLRDLQQRIAEFEDISAYKKLFFNLFLPLKSFSFSIIKSKEIAEEVVSDVFLDIWVRRKQLLEIEDIKMYLFYSVRNNSLRKLKQSQKNAVISLDELQVEFASSDPNAISKILSKELATKIDYAIEQLPPQCKIVFKMVKEDKLRYKEIAQILNISVKTIDNQLSTALKKIASVLNTSVKKPSAN